MKNPNPVNLQTSEQIRKQGWQGETRDADGHLHRTHVPFETDEDIVWFVREALEHGETVTIWPQGAAPAPQTNTAPAYAFPAPEENWVKIEPKRWLLEEAMPSGSVRWTVFQHEQQCRSTAAASEHPVTVTPLWDHQAPQNHVAGDTIICDSTPIAYANRAYTELRSEPSNEFFIRVYGPEHANHPKVHPLDPALIGIAEEVKESGGHWQPCTGCYDTEDGHPTQKYAFSQALQTSIGCGCHECGGLGAVWWHMTDEEVDDFARSCKEIDTEYQDQMRTARLKMAARDVVAAASDTYKKRNGHLGSLEDDSGEKCWIVPFDAFEALRSAVATTEGLENG